MGNAKANTRQGRDDGLSVLNLCFFIAVALAAMIVIYAYVSSGRSTLPSETQMPSSLEGFTVQGQALYDLILNKVNEFVQWGRNMLSSLA